MNPATVAILGLGEAGATIAADLVARGVEVRGYDPAVPPPEGVIAAADDADACRDADLIISLTTAHESEAAFWSAAPGIPDGALYADMNTAAAGLKHKLAALARREGVSFADVALMAPVPGRGITTPALVSGSAAARVVAALNAVGGNAQLLDGPAGAAATRKLLRSVFYKGLAAAVTEALVAARAAGCEEWLRGNIADELTASDAETVTRLETGSRVHAARRTDEMQAAVQLLTELDVPPRVAAASRDWLAQLAAADTVTP